MSVKQVTSDAKENIIKLMVAVQQGADKAKLLDIASMILTDIVRLEQVTAEGVPDEDWRATRRAEPMPEVIQDEVRKVGGRLRLWAQRPHQFNHRILRLFLELVRSGEEPVTIGMMEQAFVTKGYGDARKFLTNFTQMAHIAPNNHGKVFDVNFDELSIWPPVADDVAAFERYVLGDTT